ncbi:MAG: hypothetical protein K1X67_00060 [Fimbriimonadaceae bacterium]|nr:hypothetical protein [Fimbriimonadaceae bacterium]
MKTLKTFAIVGMALTALGAHAENATLGSLSIDRGSAPSATLGKLSRADGDSFRITGIFSNFAWSVLAGTRIPKAQVGSVYVTIRAKKVRGIALLSMFNVTTNRWQSVRTLPFPTDTFGYATTAVTDHASDFVGNGGKIRVKVDSILPGSMHFDYLNIRVER